MLPLLILKLRIFLAWHTQTFYQRILEIYLISSFLSWLLFYISSFFLLFLLILLFLLFFGTPGFPKWNNFLKTSEKRPSGCFFIFLILFFLLFYSYSLLVWAGFGFIFLVRERTSCDPPLHRNTCRKYTHTHTIQGYLHHHHHQSPSTSSWKVLTE